MTCGDLRRILSEGGRLSKEAEDHLRLCAGCRHMIDASALHAIEPEPERLARLQAEITRSLAPVRPLPSDRVLIPGLAALVIAFAVVASFAVGHKGFESLTALQRCVYYSVIIVAILGCVRMAVAEAIPGARRVPRPYAVLGLMVALLSITVMLLFGHFEVDRFAHHGWPCLTIGTMAAAVAGLLLWGPIKQGFFGSPLRAGVVAGGLCGMAGIAVLAIFCPYQNSPHILVWHFGAMLIAATVGGAIGVSDRFR